jgi:hypothetical protein
MRTEPVKCSAGAFRDSCEPRCVTLIFRDASFDSAALALDPKAISKSALVAALRKGTFGVISVYVFITLSFVDI